MAQPQPWRRSCERRSASLVTDEIDARSPQIDANLALQESLEKALPDLCEARTIRPLPGAGWSSLAARRAHNPKVAGSNPAPATNLTCMGDANRPQQGRRSCHLLAVASDRVPVPSTLIGPICAVKYFLARITSPVSNASSIRSATRLPDPRGPVAGPFPLSTARCTRSCDRRRGG